MGEPKLLSELILRLEQNLLKGGRQTTRYRSIITFSKCFGTIQNH